MFTVNTSSPTSPYLKLRKKLKVFVLHVNEPCILWMQKKKVPLRPYSRLHKGTNATEWRENVQSYFLHSNRFICERKYNYFKHNMHKCLVKELIVYPKWPNRHPIPNKHLLCNKRSLHSVKIVLDAPCLIDAPNENFSKILRISKKEQNHSIHSVSCLVNKVLHISSCSMSSSK